MGRVMYADGDCGLAGFRFTAALRDGTAVCIRAIRPDDKERLRIAFARLSARSVHQRFFHPVSEITADELRRLTEIDFRDHVGIVLTVGAGSDERLIAVGQYVRVVSGGDLAEVAFTVADDYQARGAATLLLRELVAIARKRGVRNFVALVLNDNRPMLEVFRRSKLPLRESLVDGDGVRRVVLNLDVVAARKSATPRAFLRPAQRNQEAMATILRRLDAPRSLRWSLEREPK